MKTTSTKKQASQSPTPVAVEPKIYDSWKQVPGSLRARGGWRGYGKGIKKGEKPKAFVEIDDCPLTYRNRDRDKIGLYDTSQTYDFKEPKRSKYLLIDRFVPRVEKFGLRRVGEDRPKHRDAKYLYGSVGDLVYTSFDYKHRLTGVPTRFFLEGKNVYADAIYVLASRYTNWFVIDIDNHERTKSSTKAHLLLVRHLVKKMPEIAKAIGATSVFYDYSQDSPRGIHIWVTLARRSPVKCLAETVRRGLRRFSDPALDAMLKTNRLKPMGSLEILPTEGQLIRLFGTYDRRVFTTCELQPKNNQFDAEGLVAHINSGTTNGDPSVRYAQLAIAGLGNHLQEAPSAISVPPMVLALSSTAPTQRSGYFSRIVEACLNGVTDADVLYEAYLSPLAQALYWREFHDLPDRARLTTDALVRWIDGKHNGLITRINAKHRREVINQIRHVVKNLPSTPSGIRTFWGKVVANDLVYPKQKVSLVACIDSQVVNPVQVTKDNLKRLPSLLAGSVGKTLNQYTYNVSCNPTPTLLSLLSRLPPLLEERLRKHLQARKVRTGKPMERIVLFALNLINEIGLDGTRTIGEARMNQLAGLGKGRFNVGRYKKFLRGAGILKPGWEKTYSKAKKIASRYDLTPWAINELKQANPSTSPQDLP